MYEIKFLKFALGQGMVFPVGNPVVLLRLLKILLHTPAVLIELSYAIVRIGEMAGLVQFEGPLLVLRITQRAFAQDISEIALREIVTQGDGPLIPVDGLVDVLLDADTILEEGSDVVDETRIVERLVLIVLGNDIKHVEDLLPRITVILRIAGIGKEEFATVYRDFLVDYLFVHDMIVIWLFLLSAAKI